MCVVLFCQAAVKAAKLKKALRIDLKTLLKLLIMKKLSTLFASNTKVQESAIVTVIAAAIVTFCVMF